MSEYIDKIELKNAITQYTYWNDIIDSPMGIIWVRTYFGETGKKVSLFLNAMTLPYFKRRGVCTSLLKALLTEVDVILAASTIDGGIKELILKFGFKFNPELDIYSFTKKGV